MIGLSLLLVTTITSRHVRVVTCVLLLIRLASPLRAQDVGLQGRVLSAATLKPIAGAEVRAGDASAKTDASGRFTLFCRLRQSL